MSLKFNEEQQYAIDSFMSGKSVFVSASAGTGKTTMITHAYLNLLDKGVRPSEIIAITFTNNAANEMFMKIRSLVRSRIYANSDDSILAKHWLDIYNVLTREANISTIDSFASRIVKKYSYKLDLLPNINIVGDNDKQNYDIIKNIIEHTLANDIKYQNIYKSMRLYVAYNKNKFIENIIAFNNKIKPCIGDIDRLKKDMKCLLEVSINDTHRSIYKNIQTSIDFIYQFEHSGKTIAKAKDILSIHKNNILDFDTIEKLNKTNTDESRLELKNCLDSAGVIKDNLKLGNLKGVKETGVSLTNELLPIYYDTIFKLYYKDYAENLISFLGDIFNQYEKQKILSNSLTFSDLISATISILKDKDVGLEIRQGIKYVIVDETQDTNNLQYSLINYLLFGEDEMNENFLETSDKVAFIVGDRKQSIYRFRNANITSFLNIDKIFKNSKNSESVYLNRNYRSDKYLIEFFNSMFSAIFEDDEIEYSSGDNFVSENILENKSVEYLVLDNSVPDPKNTYVDDTDIKISAEEKHQLEAEAAAYHIRNKLDSDDNLSYDKFAILLPVFSNLHNYIASLTKYNIPFYINGGKGFFSRPEVINIINFLKYLVLKENELLPLIINKTFFDISEGELYIVNRILLENDVKLKDLFIKDRDDILKCFDSFADIKNKIILIRNIILKLFDYAHHENASIIISTLVRETKYNAYLMTTDEAQFSYSNVEKFIEMAYTYERQSGASIYSFIESINDISSADEKYAAVPLLKINAVTIMTVHASKGLEFDNVIIGSLSSAQKANFSKSEFTFIDEHPHIPIYTDNNIIDLCKVDKEFDSKKQLSERRRLLYVALTRAKKSLTLIGEGNSSSYRAIIENYYKMFNEDSAFIENISTNILEHNYLPNSNLGSEKNNIKIYSYDKSILDVSSQKDTTQIVQSNNIKINIKKHCDSAKKIIVRASGNKTDMPILYNIKDLLDNNISQYNDFDEALSYNSENDFEGDDKISIMDIGSMAHLILELFNHSEYKNSGQEYIDKIIDIAKQKLERYTNKNDAIKKITIAIQSYINSSHVQNILSGAEKIFMREHAFEKREKDENGNINIMRSRIDLITYDSQNDIYYIIDYKLSSGKNSILKDTYKKQMKIYQDVITGFLNVHREKIKTEIMYLL